MAAVLRRGALVLVTLCLSIAPAFTEAAAGGNPGSAPEGPRFGFNLGLGIGVQTYNEPGPVTYQSISLAPEFSYGKLGVGLLLALNFTASGNSYVIRQADWVPTDFQNFLQIYLSKISYIRWGVKGDPLFLKLGSFNDVTLGDGFIMGNYTNMYFLPQDRHFGFEADVDGSLFEFPYLGMETFIGNLAIADVLGGRVYVRPLAGSGVPILSGMEVGGTLVADTATSNPVQPAAVPPSQPVAVFGGDIRVPLLSVKDTATLIAFTDVASIQAMNIGGALGVGGRLINIFTYGAQLRLMQASFIPDYFGPLYDVTRQASYSIVQSGVTGITFGYLVSAGTSLLGDKIVFTVSLDGPFSTPASSPTQIYPHLHAVFTIADGALPGISLDFSYDKQAISSFAELVSANYAAVAAQLNFRTGPAVISFVYQLSYMPGQVQNPTITSGIQSSIALF
ncbi:MAG TPA: hypothetical protein VMV03_03260 [Spirochaetia bacterium]|nr:hypothetical protein [Spirochaetia bacterium]